MAYKGSEAERLYKNTWAQAKRLLWTEEERAERYARKRAWYVANREKALAYARTYEESHKAERVAYRRAYNVEHRAELTAKTRARRRANPAALAASLKRYSARKKGAPLNDLTHTQWLEIQSAQKHQCYYCKARCKGRLTQDHITPLSQGGSHTLHNVIGACRSCNSKKHTSTPPIPVQPLLLTIARATKKRRKA